MAEWSKALCLGRSIFGCVGSKPTPVIFSLQIHTRQISTGIVQIKVRVKSITEQTKQENLSRKLSKRQDGRVV